MVECAKNDVENQISKDIKGDKPFKNNIMAKNTVEYKDNGG